MNCVLRKAWFITAMLWLTVGVASLKGQEEVLRFERISTEQGLSQSSVFAIIQDADGFLWIGTDDGLNKYDGYQFDIYRHDPEEPASISDNRVRCMILDNQNKIWVGTMNGGVNLLDPATGKFTHYRKDSQPDGLAGDRVKAILQDTNGAIWIGTEKGLNRLDPETNKIDYFRSASDNSPGILGEDIHALYQDKSGFLWIGTEEGLTQMNLDNGQLKVFTLEDKAHQLGAVSAILEDEQGNFWVGANKGLARKTPEAERFTRYPSQGIHGVNHEEVDSILQDSHGQIWIGTSSSGLFLYEPQTEAFLGYKNDPGDLRSLSNNDIQCIFEDRTGVLWFGAFGGGVSKYNNKNHSFQSFKFRADAVMSFLEDRTGGFWVGTLNGNLYRTDPQTGKTRNFLDDPPKTGVLGANPAMSMAEDREGHIWIASRNVLTRYDPERDRFTTYQNEPNNPDSLSGERVYRVYVSPKGVLWIGSFGYGLNRYNPKTNSFTRFRHEPENPKSIAGDDVFAILEDRTGALWVGDNGSGLSRMDANTGEFERFTYNPATPNSLSSNDVKVLHEDADGGIWIGTVSGLNRFEPKTGQLERFSGDDVMPSDNINGILEDDKGNLWVSTNRGVSKLDIATRKFKTFNTSHGLWGEEFNHGAFYKNKKGEMFFGAIGGYNRFRPEMVKINSRIPTVLITGVKRGAVENTPFKDPSQEEKPIILTHEDPVISFEFTSFDFMASKMNQYAYKLDGFLDDWIANGTERTAKFINLPAGTYDLQVKATNNDGVWSEVHDTLTLVVKPPLWRTTFAYIIYALTVLAAILAYIGGQKKKLERERILNEKLRRLDRLKDDFLANTSHELRTPLNGIIGLVDSLLDGVAGPLHAKATHNLQMVLYSGKRLANLVNDILDFAKLKEHSIELRPKPVDLHALTDVVLTLTRPLVVNKNLELINEIPHNLPPAHGDEGRLQQVMYNLIGNAIKFTEKGAITVSAVEEGSHLHVRVADTGIGVSPEQTERIFEYFEQAHGSIDRTFGGTGLGLAISRQLIEHHGGKIWVESSPGKGSTFQFTVPVSHGALEQQIPPKPPAQISAVIEDLAVPSQPVAITGKSGANILIVDDEPVNRQVLENHLAPRGFNIFHADTGEAALLELKRRNFSLILLDIMMPRMSGYDVCKKIREHYPVQELPVIFITARDQINDLVSAFGLGANDYLTKPVDRNELLSRVGTHLELADINRTLERKVAERTRELQNRNLELETLDNIVTTINREIELEDVLRTLLDQGLLMFSRANMGTAYLWDDDSELFNVVAVRGREIETVPDLSFPYQKVVERYSEEAEEIGSGVYLMRAKARLAHNADFPGLPEAKSLLAMSVRMKNRFVGFLVLINTTEENAFAQSDIRLLTRFREHAVSAVVKARIFSELHTKNEALVQTQGQLVMQEKMASIGILTAGVAHEIKNPLNFVNNFSELCVELAKELKEELGVKQKELDSKSFESLNAILQDIEENVAVIHEHGNRANNIVQSMMMLSQNKPADRQPVKLNHLVDEYVNLAYHGRRLKETKTGVKLTKDYDPTLETLEVVPSNLGRVIINLVNNAYDALVDKKKRIGDDFSPEIKVTTHNFGSGGEIRIFDNGPGIAPDNLQKIYNPFFTTKPTGKGNIGLGLSICFDIVVQEHSGEINVNTEEGEYTEFVLYIPSTQSVMRRKTLPLYQKNSPKF